MSTQVDNFTHILESGIELNSVVLCCVLFRVKSPLTSRSVIWYQSTIRSLWAPTIDSCGFEAPSRSSTPPRTRNHNVCSRVRRGLSRRERQHP